MVVVHAFEKYFGRLVRVYLMLITIERKTNGQ